MPSFSFKQFGGGIGVLLELDNEGRPSVEDVFPEGPAFEAGLLTTDTIISVDGVDARDWDLEELGAALRGPINTVVQVGILRADGTQTTLPLRRRRVIPNVVSLDYVDDVAVIRVTRFNAMSWTYSS